MPHRIANSLHVAPDKGSLELTEELIRERAYHYFEQRGCEHGHDLEDWLRAEAEVFGRKPAATIQSGRVETRGKAAAA
jgi:hypothetical protein